MPPNQTDRLCFAGLGASGRITALILHADGEVLDYLTRSFGGFDVRTALSPFRAQALLEGDRAIDVVITPWEPGGSELYRWVLQRRPELRGKFVFVADEVPAEFDSIVRGRCLTVPLTAPAELIRVATVVARRRVPVPTPVLGVPVLGRPTLLLVDDDPMLIDVMAGVLSDAGYTVTQADSAAAATNVLAHQDFDAIVCDTHVDLYDWIVEHKPTLAARLVFLGEGNTDTGRPSFRKGQDSGALIKLLGDIVTRVRR